MDKRTLFGLAICALAVTSVLFVTDDRTDADGEYFDAIEPGTSPSTYYPVKFQVISEKDLTVKVEKGYGGTYSIP